MKLRDVVYVTGNSEVMRIVEISEKEHGKEYKLWKEGTVDYAWFEGWQITTDTPTKIGFNVG